MHGQNETEKPAYPERVVFDLHDDALAVSAAVELNTNKHVG